MHLEKLRPTHTLLTPFRGGVDVMAPQNVAHRDLVDVMAQIRQRALNAAVTPGGVVIGYLQDKGFDLIRDSGSSQFVTLLAAVKLLSDKLSNPDAFSYLLFNRKYLNS